VFTYCFLDVYVLFSPSDVSVEVGKSNGKRNVMCLSFMALIVLCKALALLCLTGSWKGELFSNFRCGKMYKLKSQYLEDSFFSFFFDSRVKYMPGRPSNEA